MSISRIFWLFLLSGLAVSCKNEPKTPTAPVPTVSQNPKRGGGSIDTSRSETVAVIEGTPQARPGSEPDLTAVPKQKSKSPGPPGYITRENVSIYAEPSLKSRKVASVKLYENVHILETRMREEDGSVSPYPTWYKVERENKQRGWVQGNSLNGGAGG